MEILKCENVRKVYGARNNQVVALDHINLSVQKGEFVAIVGASGSGKSTLLHILGSVDKPTDGKVLIEGTDISTMNRTQAAIFRRRKVGLVYQFYNLIPTLTVRKNILMPLLLDKRNPNKEYFEKIVHSLGIEDMLNGYKLIIGALCVLLAFIGIANVFSNTLGFIRQRKREFARYMSIGMTPEGMRKMFWIEALVIAGRPVLITLPITVVFVWLMITASYLNPMEFLAVAPIVPILLFIAALFGFVALAYYLGGKKILKCDLVEALRTDYMG